MRLPWSKPLVIDLLAGALPQLWQDAPIPIAGIPAARVVSYNRSNAGHQFLVFFAGAVGSVLP
jgi:hypothetical protein